MSGTHQSPPDLQTHLRDLELVVEEYTDWFMRLMRRVFYPQSSGVKIAARPQSFSNWLQGAKESNLLASETLGGLAQVHQDMIALAEQLVNDTLRSGQPPAFDSFDKLVTFFEEFIHSIRRISRDYLLDDVGIDPTTGLRTRDMFYKDIRREIDRLARQGKAFVVALIKIDDFLRLRDNLESQNLQTCLKTVSAIIKKSIRSFDDAYSIDDGQFLVSLKQTGVSGGMKALHRMRAMLEKENLIYKLKDAQVTLSLSACIAEPLPEDDMRELLENIKTDLNSYAHEKGMMIEYKELSPLQRLMKEGRE